MIYAVRNGRKTGIFHTWVDCETQVKNFPSAKFKKFKTINEAHNYLGENFTNNLDSTSDQKADDGTTRSSVEQMPHSMKSPVESTKITDFFKSVAPTKDKDNDKMKINKVKCEDPVGQQDDLMGLGKDGDNGVITVYTDGSCLGNGRRRAKAGIGVFFGFDDSRNVSEPFRDNPTNQRAELAALIRALEIVGGTERVTIYTDSRYSIDCVLKFSRGWIRNGWKTAKGEPVKNQDLIKPLLDLMRPGVSLIHIRAHTGRTDQHSIGNSQADRLAVEGSNFF